MDINPSLFKAYDIRGTVPDQLTPEVAYRIGRAYADYIRVTVLHKERDPIVVLGMDARASSESLKVEFIRGLLDEGCTVLDCGFSTTPLFYFSVNHLEADGGVMITASHNPAQYNGFKLTRRGAVPIGGGMGMEEIQNTALRGVFTIPERQGTVVQKNVQNEYVDFLFRKINVSRIKSFHVVFDLGNGMTGLLLEKVCSRLPISKEVLYGDIDLTFPNHEANPLQEETLDVLKKRVVEYSADFGVAFDADGDRIGLITHNGEHIGGDHITALLAGHLLKKYPGNKVLYDLRSSKAVPEYIQEQGGVPVEGRVGHAFIKARMREEQILLAGEVSGHYYFRDFFYAESSFLTFLYILEMLSEEETSLDELWRPLRRYVATGELNFTVENKEKILDALAYHYRDAKNVRYLDGLSITYPDFWFNVRPSNTEPYLRLNLEAKDENVLTRALQEIQKIVNK